MPQLMVFSFSGQDKSRVGRRVYTRGWLRQPADNMTVTQQSIKQIRSACKNLGSSTESDRILKNEIQLGRLETNEKTIRIHVQPDVALCMPRPLTCTATYRYATRQSILYQLLSQGSVESGAVDKGMTLAHAGHHLG
jgi:hypothetical protein